MTGFGNATITVPTVLRTEEFVKTCSLYRGKDIFYSQFRNDCCLYIVFEKSIIHSFLQLFASQKSNQLFAKQSPFDFDFRGIC